MIQIPLIGLPQQQAISFLPVLKSEIKCHPNGTPSGLAILRKTPVLLQTPAAVELGPQLERHQRRLIKASGDVCEGFMGGSVKAVINQ